MMSFKLGGIAFIVIGASILVGFPSASDFQPEEFTKAGMSFGVILIAIGIFLMIT